MKNNDRAIIAGFCLGFIFLATFYITYVSLTQLFKYINGYDI